MSQKRPRLSARGFLAALSYLLRERGVEIADSQVMETAVAFTQLHQNQVIPTVESLKNVMRDEQIYTDFNSGITAYKLAKKLELSHTQVRRIIGTERLRMRRAERDGKRLEKVKAQWL